MIQISQASSDIATHHIRQHLGSSIDPLTKCLNRRAFFGGFERQWEDVQLQQLAVMMLDVDHLKAVNDSHGPALGDEILSTVGELLNDQIGDNGLVCRYGGEEFAVMLSGVRFDDCVSMAQKLRERVEHADVTGIKFTVSIGLSSRSFGSMDPQHMLDQAEECLKLAKSLGRNQVIRFDERSRFSDETSTAERSLADEIPFSAVTGLLSALSFRSQSTAQHSIRVADLCRCVGENLLQNHELYQLEVAALLHDIGKIGVPDAILNKPGPLTAEEWKTMRKHDQIGVEIVRSAFASETVASVIESHHDCFMPRKKLRVPPRSDLRISLTGRIIAVCDAFDSLTHDQVYRSAFSERDAIQEMLQFTPEQFDAEVMSHLVALVESGLDSSLQRRSHNGPMTERVGQEANAAMQLPCLPDRIGNAVLEKGRNGGKQSVSADVGPKATATNAREGEFAGDPSYPIGDLHVKTETLDTIGENTANCTLDRRN